MNINFLKSVRLSLAVLAIALVPASAQMNPKYTMPASHPAVHAGVDQLIAWGAPSDVEYYDFVDAWGYPTHEVRFHTQTKLYNAIAGLLAVNPDGSSTQNLTVAFNEMKVLGMIEAAKTVPTPVVTKQPTVPAAVDATIGAADPNRPGLYEPAAGTNPNAGDSYTSADGRKWLALQVSFGFGGAAVNLRWMPLSSK